MKSPLVIKKQKLKKSVAKSEDLTVFDARKSAKKAEEILKKTKNKSVNFIEVE